MEVVPDPAVSCSVLNHSFGTTRALDGVSFEVGAGEVFGLLGPNGAGKTTVIRIVTTLLRPESGHAAVFGLDCRRESVRVRRLLGYVPQQLSADPGLTGYENVWLFARLFDIPRGRREGEVRLALGSMGLEDAAGRMVATYSGGMVRRLELAQALVSRPRLLILDEPTIGLDPIARTGVWDRVRTLQAETGMTVLLTTHYMEEADELCDRMAVMHRGTVRALGTPSELKEALHPDATLDDVFRHHTGDPLSQEGSFRDVRATRRTARRLG
ncbi:MAG: ATP-binding cassette domain-containing protein [Candidatus Dormibacteria bacterium]